MGKQAKVKLVRRAHKATVRAGPEPTQENVIKAALVLIAERLKKREAIRGR